MFGLLTGEVPEARSDPKTENEAMNRPDASRWLEAETEEYQSLMEADVADVVDRPDDAPVLPAKMVYKTKRNEHGETVRFKARYVPWGVVIPGKL